MSINTGTLPRRLSPGVHTWYGSDWKAFDLMYPKIFSVEKSSKNFEDLLSIAGTGLAVVKDEGGGYTSDTIAQSNASRLVHAVYGKIMTLTLESVNDDQYSPKIEQLIGSHLAKSMKETRETIAHNVLNDGFSTVSGKTYNNPDAKALFATDHPNPKGGTFSNKLSVDADLSEASLEQICINIKNMKDEAGIRMGNKPVKLIVPVAEMFNADRLLYSTGRVGTADNDLNTVGRMGLSLIVTPYASDDDAYFVSTDVKPGLIFMEREGIQMGERNEFSTDNIQIKVRERYSVGYGNARCIHGSQGA